jgi:hypothetical protein
VAQYEAISGYLVGVTGESREISRGLRLLRRGLKPDAVSDSSESVDANNANIALRISVRRLP